MVQSQIDTVVYCMLRFKPYYDGNQLIKDVIIMENKITYETKFSKVEWNCVIPTPIIWNAEDHKSLHIYFEKSTWCNFKILSIHIGSQMRTGCRVKIEILGPNDYIIASKFFAVDWEGSNNLKLWLDKLGFQPQKETFSEVCGLRMICETPGIQKSVLSIERVSVYKQNPTWDVNKSDTIIDMSWASVYGENQWATNGANISEWNSVNNDSVEGFTRKQTNTGYLFEYTNDDANKQVLIVERKFDMDISDFSQLLSKMIWSKDTLLTFTLIVDGNKLLNILKNSKFPHDNVINTHLGDWLVIGGSLNKAKHLEGIRITLTGNKKLEPISMKMFWILLRKSTEADNTPVKKVSVYLSSQNHKIKNDKIVERQVKQMLLPPYDESVTPIKNPLTDGLPLGFYITRENLLQIRNSVLYGEGKTVLKRIIEQADEAISSDLVQHNFYGTSYGGGVGLPKGVNGGGMKTYAPVVALAHLLTGEEKYAINVRRWILRAARSEDWRGEHGGCVNRPQINDVLPFWDSFTGWYPKGYAGYMNHPFFIADVAYGVVISYDMIYHCLNVEERNEVENAFAKHGVYMLYDKLKNNRNFYINMNQGAIFATPLLMLTAFLKDKSETYRKIYEWTLEFLKEYPLGTWSEEGVSREGPGYGMFSFSHYIEAIFPLAACLNEKVENMVSDKMNNVFNYFLNCLSTCNEFEMYSMPISDLSGRWVWQGELLIFMAKYMKNTYAKYYWDKYYKDNPPPSIITLLSLDNDTLAEVPKLPLVQIYKDEPMAFLRTGLSYGDTVLAMTNICNVKGHGHKDRASILLEYNKEPLILDPGYKNYSSPDVALYSQTFCHNTMTFSQKNQKGGYNNYKTSITDYLSISESEHIIDWVTTDATDVYSEAEKYVRHIIFLRPDVFVIVDDVIAKAFEKIELNFTCLGPVEKKDKNLFTSKTKMNQLNIHSYALEELEHNFKTFGTLWDDVPSYRLILSTKNMVKSCCFITALSPSPLDRENKIVIEKLNNKDILGLSIKSNDCEDIFIYNINRKELIEYGAKTDTEMLILHKQKSVLTGGIKFHNNKLEKI